MDSENDPPEIVSVPAVIDLEEAPLLTEKDFRTIREEVIRIGEAMRRRITAMEALTEEDWRVRVK